MVRPVNCSYFENGSLQRRLCRSSSAFCCGPLSARYCSSTACDYMDHTSGITPTVFWSILGVLSGIGALIIGITYLICRFKKPTNQVADRDQNMVEDNFVHTDVRTVLYPDNHLEHQRLQPAPVVRLEHNRPPYYGAAAHHSPPSAVATSAVPDASTSMPTPLTTTSTTVGNCSRLNQLCLETWTGFDPIDIKNTSASRQPSGGLSNINSGRQAQLEPTVVHSAIARSAKKFNCVSNFLTVKPKRTSVDV